MKNSTILALLVTTVLSGCAAIGGVQEAANSQLVNFNLSGDNILMTADVHIGEKMKSEALCDPYDIPENKNSVSFSPMYEPRKDGMGFSDQPDAQISWILSSDLDEAGKACVTEAMNEGLSKSNADFVVSPSYTLEKVQNKKGKERSLYSSNEKLKATVRFYPGYYTNIRKAVVVAKPENKASCCMLLPVVGVDCKSVIGKDNCK